VLADGASLHAMQDFYRRLVDPLPRMFSAGLGMIMLYVR
jgi:hypothetical protein